MKLVLIFVAACIGLSFLSADTANAQDLNEYKLLTSGSVSLAGFTSVPYGAFRFVAEDIIIEGTLRDGYIAAECNPCREGQTITLASLFSDSASIGPGFAYINSRSYKQIFYTGTVRFDTKPTKIPPIGPGQTVTLAVPFSFAGDVKGCRQNPVSGCPQGWLFDESLRGEGVATVSLRNPFLGPGTSSAFYFMDRLSYEFVPMNPAARLLNLLRRGKPSDNLFTTR